MKSNQCERAVRRGSNLPRRRFSFALCLFLLWMPLVSRAQAPADKHAASATKVILFEPSIPESGNTVTGNCWTESIAANRPGAWRCMAGNLISDPCFERNDMPGRVICGANPATDKSGFILKLEKALPKPSEEKSNAVASPWMLALADGSVCSAHTGTMAVVGKSAVRYGCSDSSKCENGDCPRLTGVLEELKQGNVWIAQKVVFTPSHDSAAPFKLIEKGPIAVRTVWE